MELHVSLFVSACVCVGGNWPVLCPKGLRWWTGWDLGVWWNDSTGAQQGQSAQLHLWPFCSFLTWPLTVFMCYMTRISEPWPFRVPRAADSLFTELSIVVRPFRTRLTPHPSSRISARSKSPYVSVDGCFWMKMIRGFTVASIHTWHSANEREKKLSLHSANLGLISQSQPIHRGEEKEKIKHLPHFPNWR